MKHKSANLIRWSVLILFGFITLAGDALHWLPGTQCCSHSHRVVHEHESSSHQHAGHEHHHHHTHAQDTSAAEDATWRSTLVCDTDCLICRWLASSVYFVRSTAVVDSAPHCFAFHVNFVDSWDQDLPRYSAPRGPPSLLA